MCACCIRPRKGPKPASRVRPADTEMGSGGGGGMSPPWVQRQNPEVAMPQQVAPSVGRYGGGGGGRVPVRQLSNGNRTRWPSAERPSVGVKGPERSRRP